MWESAEDYRLEELLSIGQVTPLIPYDYSAASGGSASARGLGFKLLSGGDASGLAVATIDSFLSANGSFPRENPFSVAFNVRAEIGNENGHIVFGVGLDSLGVLEDFGSDVLVDSGIGCRIYYSDVNAQTEVTLFGHDGVDYFESDPAALVFNSSRWQPMLLAWHYGLLMLFVGENTEDFSPAGRIEEFEPFLVMGNLGFSGDFANEGNMAFYAQNYTTGSFGAEIEFDCSSCKTLLGRYF